MTEFELITIPVSLVLGLGVARILGGYVQVIRERDRVRPHATSMLWAFGILLLNVVYFNALYDMSLDGEPWTWARYGPVLVQTGLLFLSASLILPPETAVERGMLDDFERNGRLALVPLGLLLATAPIANRLNGSPWIGLNNLANLVLTGVIVAAFLMRRDQRQVGLAALFAVLMVLSMLFAWAQPGTA